MYESTEHYAVCPNEYFTGQNAESKVNVQVVQNRSTQ